MPTTIGFMDALTITTEKPVHTRWVLSVSEKSATWARMKFKLRKSRSLTVTKGKVSESVQFKIQEKGISSISSSPKKCLEKWYDGTLKDINSIEGLKQQVYDEENRQDRTAREVEA